MIGLKAENLFTPKHLFTPSYIIIFLLLNNSENYIMINNINDYGLQGTENSHVEG